MGQYIHFSTPNPPYLASGHVSAPSSVRLSQVIPPAPPQSTSVADGLFTFQQLPLIASGSTRPSAPTTELDPLTWVPYATRVVVADYLRRGHPFCVQYAMASWPESVLPVAHWEYFATLPATTQHHQNIVLRLRLHDWLEVQASETLGFVTVADVLRSLYGVRARFPNSIFIGLSPAGLNHLIVHMDS
jgi:hypothetical protein